MLKNTIYLLLLSLAGLGYWKRAELGDYWERIQLASSELITPPSMNTAPNAPNDQNEMPRIFGPKVN